MQSCACLLLSHHTQSFPYDDSLIKHFANAVGGVVGQRLLALIKIFPQIPKGSLRFYYLPCKLDYSGECAAWENHNLLERRNVASETYGL